MVKRSASCVLKPYNRSPEPSPPQVCVEHGCALTLTCVEMCDAQHPTEALCGPEGLLRQVRGFLNRGICGYRVLEVGGVQARSRPLHPLTAVSGVLLCHRDPQVI